MTKFCLKRNEPKKILSISFNKPIDPIIAKNANSVINDVIVFFLKLNKYQDVFADKVITFIKE